MNLVEQLTFADFGRSFDPALFEKWKYSIADHAKAGRTTMILFFIGLAVLILLGGLIGLITFFILALVGIFMAMPKKKAVQEYQKQLGISNDELKNVLSRKRMQMRGA